MNYTGTIREIHTAFVTDNADPEMRGRLKVRCDTLAGTETELPDWIEPVFPYLAGVGAGATAGWFFVPDIGIAVEVEVTTGSQRDETPGAVSIEAPDMRWRACVPVIGGDEVHEDFRANYPNRRGIITAAGHGLVFDDTSDDPEVKLQQVNDSGTTFLDFDESGSATLLTSTGLLLYMDQSEDAGAISLVDTNGNLLYFSEEGWLLKSGQSAFIHAKDSVLTLATPQTLLVNGTLLNAQVGEMRVQQVGLDSSVIIEGVGQSFSTLLSGAMGELAAVCGILGIPATNAASLLSALAAGVHTATRLKTE